LLLLFILRILLITGILVFMASQIIIPVFQNRPLFPFFTAREERKLLVQLSAKEQEEYEEFLRSKLTRIEESKSATDQS